MMNYADREATRVMLEELRHLEDYIRNATSTTREDYAIAVDRAIELRKRLGL